MWKQKPVTLERKPDPPKEGEKVRERLLLNQWVHNSMEWNVLPPLSVDFERAGVVASKAALQMGRLIF